MLMIILQIIFWLSSFTLLTHDNCKGEMLDGTQHGPWQCFYENGKVREEGDYQKGQKTGHWKFYHENGNIALEGDYTNGHESGSWKMYDESGTHLDTIEYGN
jgi:antitoxin component YwqK of YwqJK toxin-antitoxin module